MNSKPTFIALVGIALVAAASLLIATNTLGGDGDETSHATDETTQMTGMSGDTTGSHETTQQGPRLLMPIMNSTRGRKLFAAKGCVTCHAINGIGGHDAPNLDAHAMDEYMNPFEFAARMWRGASTMIYMQEELGEQIEFTGDELADIIAFVHDDGEQHKFSEADIPPEIMSLMGHEHAPPGGEMEHADELGHMGDDDGHADGEGDEHQDE